MDGWTDGRMDEQTDGRIHVAVFIEPPPRSSCAATCAGDPSSHLLTTSLHAHYRLITASKPARVIHRAVFLAAHVMYLSVIRAELIHHAELASGVTGYDAAG